MVKEGNMKLLEQQFDNSKKADVFISLMSKYIKPEQIKRQGNKVSVEATADDESWFLFLFWVNVESTKYGVKMPDELMDVQAMLARNLGTPKAQEIIDHLEAKGIYQADLNALK